MAFFYTPDANLPAMLTQITQPVSTTVTASRLNAVHSFFLSCGPSVSSTSGAIDTTLSSSCIAKSANNVVTGAIPSLLNLGVIPELVLGSFTRGLCSIAAYRALWADTTVSIPQLVVAAQLNNARGWHLTLEEAVTSCSSPSTQADALQYAVWLNALRAALHAVNM